MPYLHKHSKTSHPPHCRWWFLRSPLAEIWPGLRSSLRFPSRTQLEPSYPRLSSLNLQVDENYYNLLEVHMDILCKFKQTGRQQWWCKTCTFGGDSVVPIRSQSPSPTATFGGWRRDDRGCCIKDWIFMSFDWHVVTPRSSCNMIEIRIKLRCAALSHQFRLHSR